MSWINIPEDVINWFQATFAEANRVTAETLLNTPNIRETSLDDTFIQALIPRSAPTLLPSGAVVKMDIHNIGGLRQVESWEIADIGIVVFIVRSKRVIARKLALLQAKRLYPRNNDVDSEDPTGFLYGFNKFLRQDPSPVSILLARNFIFNEDCLYGAINAGSHQIDVIERFIKKSGHTVDYLLYNPPTVPVSVTYPVTNHLVVEASPTLGCRVVSNVQMHKLLGQVRKGGSPSLGQVVNQANTGLRIESWIGLLLRCEAGRQYSTEQEEDILPILERRSGPIGAAIAVTVELPPKHGD